MSGLRQKAAECTRFGQIRSVTDDHFMVVEFVEAGIDQPILASRSRTVGSQALFRALAMAASRTQHDLVELETAVLDPAAQQPRLLFTQRRQPVIVVGAETGLAVTHQMNCAHARSLDYSFDAAISRRQRFSR